MKQERFAGGATSAVAVVSPARAAACCCDVGDYDSAAGRIQIVDSHQADPKQSQGASVIRNRSTSVALCIMRERCLFPDLPDFTTACVLPVEIK